MVKREVGAKLHRVSCLERHESMKLKDTCLFTTHAKSGRRFHMFARRHLHKQRKAVNSTTERVPAIFVILTLYFCSSSNARICSQQNTKQHGVRAMAMVRDGTEKEGGRLTLPFRNAASSCCSPLQHPQNNLEKRRRNYRYLLWSVRLKQRVPTTGSAKQSHQEANS